MTIADVTIFTTCKDFVGQTAFYQEMAIRSWRNLGFNVVLMGGETGVAEIAKVTGCRHVLDIDYSPSGIPTVNGLFAKALQTCSTPYLCYVNADIILGPQAPAVFSIYIKLNLDQPHRLLLTRRINVPYFEMDASFEECLSSISELQDDYGVTDRADALDLFLYDRALYQDIPPFEIGRMQWDNWLLDEAIRKKAAIVDASFAMEIIHPFHDYQGGLDMILFGKNTLSNQRLSTVSHSDLNTAATHRFINDQTVKPVQDLDTDGLHISQPLDLSSGLDLAQETKAFLYFFEQTYQRITPEKHWDCIRQFLWRNQLYFPFSTTHQDGKETAFALLEKTSATDDYVVQYKMLQDFICCSQEVKLRQMQQQGRNLYIWGTGGFSVRMMAWLSRKNIKVTAFVDSYNDKSSLSSLPVYAPQVLQDQVSKPFILIASMYFKDIAVNLEEIGYSQGVDF